MYYITFNNDTKKVVYVGNKKPSVGGDASIAEVDTIPEKYDYLTVVNEREKTDTWTETIEELNENGEIITKEVEMSRTYATCDLITNFRPQPISAQLNTLKDKQYSTRVTQLVRKKYDANAVEALLANYTENKEKYQAEFDVFASYRKQCKEQAHKEVYGE